MAIGYSPMGVPFKLSSEDMGVPDLQTAIMKGLTAGNAPAKMSSELLGQHLKNAIDKAKAKYAPQMEEANLANMIASTQGLQDTHGISGINRQLIQQKIDQGNYEQQLNKSIFGGRSSSSLPDYGPSDGQNMPKPNLRDNVTDGMGTRSNSNIVSAGNKDLYHIDDMIDSSPQAASYLKKHFNYEKKVTPKYDPKTGITSVMTQYPSGKVELTASGVKANNGKSPLTTKTVSTLQAAKVAIPQLRQVIDQLIKSPSPVSLPFGIPWRPGVKKEHDDLVNLGKDLFAKVKALTSTEHALKTGEQVLERGSYSSDESYHKALLKTKALLDDDEKGINDALNEGVSTSPQLKTSSKKNDPLGIR